MVISLTFSLTSSHLHPLQVENCESNSRLVVDENGTGKFSPERVGQYYRPTGKNPTRTFCFSDFSSALHHHLVLTVKWNELGFSLSLCIYRLNWARRSFWGWWDEWDDTVLQKQDSKFDPWRSEAEHANSRSRMFYTILNLYEWTGKKHFISFKLEYCCLAVPDQQTRHVGPMLG